MERVRSRARATMQAVLPRLIDDGTEPYFRDVFRILITGATEVRVALTHLRLSTLDLTDEELAGMRRIRLLLAQVNATDLDMEAYHLLRDPKRGGTLRRLGRLLEGGVIEVRSAPLGGWSPDFTVFSRPSGPDAALLGYHAFERPHPARGPSFASVHGATEARVVAERFDRAWGRGHDVAPAIRGILRRRAE